MANPHRIQGFVSGYVVGVPAASEVIGALVATAPGQIRTVVARAAAGGSGTAAIIDLQINGVSAYTDPAHRPQLAAGVSGTFTSFQPNHSAIQPGDLVSLVAVSSGNKSQIVATAALEEP